MDDVFGLLAFVSLIAAQFLAVVVAYSEHFESVAVTPLPYLF
jgi:hypothetical protein